MQNWPKIGLGGVPGGLLEALGGQYLERRSGISFLEASWGRLGAPWGPSWRPLGAVLAILAASWACLGPVLASKIWPKVAPKIDHFVDHFSDQFFNRFWIDVWSIFHFLKPHQSSKNLKFLNIFAFFAFSLLRSIFGRLWWILGAKLGLEKGAKTGQDRGR